MKKLKNKKILIPSIILILIIIIGVTIYFIKSNNIDYSLVHTQIDTNSCEDIKTTSHEILFLVNGYPLVVDTKSDEVHYNTTQLTTELANEITLCNSKGYEVLVNEEKLTNKKSLDINLDTLSMDEYINITLSKNNEEKDVLIRTLHENINFSTQGESDDGYYYFDYNNGAVKMDNEGNVVFYKVTEFIRNFKKYEIDGKTYYGHLEQAYVYDNITVEGAKHMKLIVMDDEYNIVDTVDYLNASNGIHENHSLENHDYQILDLGHYIVTAYVAEDVDNVSADLMINDDKEAKVAAAVFQEIKDDELIFEFNSINYPELYEYSTDRNNYGDDEYQDYMHLNSVIIDPNDGNYIISLRSMDGIIKVNKQTSDIMWILGGIGDQFDVGNYQPSRQHYATISINDTLTLYDNGNTNEQSRILEYKLDEDNKELIKANEFQIDGYFGSIRGSTIRLSTDENIFLSAWGETQDNKAIITEYNFDTDEKILEIYDHTEELDSKTYRVHKYDN